MWSIFAIRSYGRSPTFWMSSPIGGIDITPLIAIVLLGALQRNMGAMIFAPLASLIG